MNEDILILKQKIEDWKSSTKNQSTKIPSALINNLKQIYQKHQDDNLYKKLGISRYNWNKRVIEKKTKNMLSKNSNKLVLLENINNKNNDNLIPLIKLKLKSGTEITIYQ